MDQLNIITQVAISQWEQHVTRATRLLKQMPDEVLSSHIAPGKNTGTYVVGHLIAIHDAMPKILGIGEAQHPELFDVYVAQPDSADTAKKTVQELRDLWDETHERVTNLIKEMPEEDWLKRHASMTDEDFEANPYRNRLSVLLNRTNHFAFHLGQLRLLVS